MAERLYGRDPPDGWVPGTGFMEDSFSKDGVGWAFPPPMHESEK